MKRILGSRSLGKIWLTLPPSQFPHSRFLLVFGLLLFFLLWINEAYNWWCVLDRWTPMTRFNDHGRTNENCKVKLNSILENFYQKLLLNRFKLIQWLTFRLYCLLLFQSISVLFFPYFLSLYLPAFYPFPVFSIHHFDDNFNTTLLHFIQLISHLLWCFHIRNSINPTAQGYCQFYPVIFILRTHLLLFIIFSLFIIDSLFRFICWRFAVFIGKN